MIRFARLVIVCTLVAACARLPQAGRNAASTESVRVYAAVLAEVKLRGAVRPVVIDTLMPVMDLDADRHAMITGELAIAQQALDAFVAAQQRTRGPLGSAMLPDSSWRAVPPATLDSLRAAARSSSTNGAPPARGRNDAFWSRWHERFPGSGGYVMLSPVSFSADGADALVHVWTACGAVCGESHLRKLHREADGRWRTVGRVELSVS